MTLRQLSGTHEDVPSEGVDCAAGENAGLGEPLEPLGSREEPLEVPVVGNGDASVDRSQQKGVVDEVGVITRVRIPHSR
jgi:hypothetical protein